MDNKRMLGIGVAAVVAVVVGYKALSPRGVRCPDPEHVAANPVLYDPQTCRGQRPQDVPACLGILRAINEQCPEVRAVLQRYGIGGGYRQPDYAGSNGSDDDGGSYGNTGSSDAAQRARETMQRTQCLLNCSTYGNVYQEGGAESNAACRARC